MALFGWHGMRILLGLLPIERDSNVSGTTTTTRLTTTTNVSSPVGCNPSREFSMFQRCRCGTVVVVVTTLLLLIVVFLELFFLAVAVGERFHFDAIEAPTTGQMVLQRRRRW